jgi:rhodanese-related sulfurtransferase
MNGAYAGDIEPGEAWRILSEQPGAVLIDVRTPAEWAYVGVPDLSALGKQPVCVPWLLFPTMTVNDRCVEQVRAAGVGRDAPLVFICRSGARSRSAAIRMTAEGYGACYNVATGFEGDPDGQRHRGRVNGWKVDGLPWIQS